MGDKYTPSIRRLRIEVSGLKTVRSWHADAPAERRLPDAPYLIVHGQAHIGRGDRLQLVHTTVPAATALSFECRGILSEAALSEKWTQERARWSDLSLGLGLAPTLRSARNEEETRLNNVAYQYLTERPPTAVVSYLEGEPDVNRPGTWGCECAVSTQLLELLGRDIIAGQASRLVVGITLMPTLTDAEYLPAQLPRTIGLLTPISYGWIEDFTWELTGPSREAEA